MSSMSKRAQARTERELQDILSHPGNSTCADCGARNPAWASWSLGIFLCMRCATLHRKLGTHISKVKSLTMDTWSDEQVQNMRKTGNTAANQLYNPRNKKPDMPLDADEVDNAMERFIRKKYQEKSLSHGRPEVPSRDDLPTSRPKSPDVSPAPLQPPKKKGFWTGFGLRASSSAYPLSKHDKKYRNEPRVDSAFRISSEDYTSKSKGDSRSASRKELSDSELNTKLTQLRDMGFTETEKNTVLLKKARGDVELVIASLVKHGGQGNNTPGSTERPQISAIASPGAEVSGDTSRSATTMQSSNNPFGILDNPPQQQGGIQPQQQVASQSPMSNTNPWQAAMPIQQSTGLEQTFAGMQVNARPLFPHNTGGYTTQPDPRFTQSMTPPVPNIPYPYSATASPSSTTNPFVYQTPLSAHSTGSNPYASSMHSPPPFAPSTNPFFMNSSTASQPTSPSLSNPFGLPPAETQAQAIPSFTNTNTQIAALQLQQSQNSMYQSQFQTQTMSPDATTPGFPNFNYGQPAQSPQTQFHPYQQQQPLPVQQTGRYDKTSIMALYSSPQFTSQRPLAAIPEPVEVESQYQSPNSALSPASQVQSHAAPNTTFRSVSMPTSPDQTSRNPFMANPAAAAASMQSTPALPQFSPLGQNNPYSAQLPQTKQLASGNPFGFQGGARHASAESVSVNNPALMDGRHSPDAWGGLSARYVR